MSYQVAAPQCYVQIFPYDGSSFTFPSDFKQLPNGGLLECTVSKNIHSSAPGTCELLLAPGGPNGTSIGPSWAQIIVPLSLIVVTMLRGDNGNVVFVGVVKDVSESVNWLAQTPARNTVVRCVDFQYFLTAYNFYTLTFLGTFGASTQGASPTPTYLTTIDNGLLMGTPVDMANEWLKIVNAVLKKLGFQVTSGNTRTIIYFASLIIPVFQQFTMPGASSGPFVPISFGNLATTESSWWSKFSEIFPFPMYELFLQTVPLRFMNDYYLNNYNDGETALDTSTYPLSVGNNLAYNLRMGYYNTPTIAMVARKFPFPVPDLTGENNYAPYMDQWNKLPIFYPGQETGWELSSKSPYTTAAFENASQYTSQTQISSVLQSSLTFSPDEVKNFFAVQPLFANSMAGDANGAFFAGYLNGLGADMNSISRYGYRPSIFETQWFGTGTPSTAQQNYTQYGSNYTEGIVPPFFKYMISILAAVSEPTPWMAKGVVVDLLRPDILAGNRYIYAPFKESPSELWMFYITEVTHTYVFGGRSTTTLRLERGLPVSIYEGTTSQAFTPLNQLLTGQLVRRDGQYVSAVNSAGVSLATNLPTLQIKGLSEIRGAFQDFFPFIFTGKFTTGKGDGG